jgi:hypothetical protein
VLETELCGAVLFEEDVQHGHLRVGSECSFLDAALDRVLDLSLRQLPVVHFSNSIVNNLVN